MEMNIVNWITAGFAAIFAFLFKDLYGRFKHMERKISKHSGEILQQETIMKNHKELMDETRITLKTIQTSINEMNLNITTIATKIDKD